MSWFAYLQWGRLAAQVQWGTILDPNSISSLLRSTFQFPVKNVDEHTSIHSRNSLFDGPTARRHFDTCLRSCLQSTTVRLQIHAKGTGGIYLWRLRYYHKCPVFKASAPDITFDTEFRVAFPSRTVAWTKPGWARVIHSRVCFTSTPAPTLA